MQLKCLKIKVKSTDFYVKMLWCWSIKLYTTFFLSKLTLIAATGPSIWVNNVYACISMSHIEISFWSSFRVLLPSLSFSLKPVELFIFDLAAKTLLSSLPSLELIEFSIIIYASHRICVCGGVASIFLWRRSFFTLSISFIYSRKHTNTMKKDFLCIQL